MSFSGAIAPQPASNRFVFIDQTRSLAIMLMLVGHSLDRFLAEPWRSSETYQNYQFVRGISSTLFLMISGFSFVIASFGRFEEYKHFSPRLFKRIRRIGLILFLGYVLNLWGPTLSRSIDTFSSSNLERFLRFDVLQNIAFGLTLLHVLIWICKTRAQFGKAVFSAAAVVFALGFVTYLPNVDAVLPAPLAAMANMYHHSRFPVIPYTGFLLLGAGIGAVFWKQVGINNPSRFFGLAMGAAVLLIGFDLFIRFGIPGGVFPYSVPLSLTPGNTFARAGCALIIIAALYFLGQKRTVLPRVSYVLSKDTMLIYFVHLLIVYGAASLPKFLGLEAQSMSPLELAAFVIYLAIAMGLLAAGSVWLRADRPNVHQGIRHSLILAGVLVFACCDTLTLPKIAIGALVAPILVVLWYRLRFSALNS